MPSIEYLEQPYKIVDRPLWWHKQGLQETPSGYGGKLTSSRKVQLENGKEYRIYVTCCSNASSSWITIRGKKLYLRG